jgi:hypothetical protein
MYIALTNECNMTCDHCCMSALPMGKGTYMSERVFRAALKIAQDHDAHITLGGGEPTLHPHFEKFLMLAIANQVRCDGGVCVITNGKVTPRALMIARLANAEIICGELSRDIWHDDIRPEVVEAFGKHIRDISRHHEPVNVGRATDNIYGHPPDPDERCACEDWEVHPDGRITQCGCPNAPVIGNALEGMDGYYTHACYRSDEYRQHLEEVANELLA